MSDQSPVFSSFAAAPADRAGLDAAEEKLQGAEREQFFRALKQSELDALRAQASRFAYTDPISPARIAASGWVFILIYFVVLALIGSRMSADVVLLAALVGSVVIFVSTASFGTWRGNRAERINRQYASLREAFETLSARSVLWCLIYASQSEGCERYRTHVTGLGREFVVGDMWVMSELYKKDRPGQSIGLESLEGHAGALMAVPFDLRAVGA